MRARGLEPPRACAQWDLNPSRLPIPPRPRCALTVLGPNAAEQRPAVDVPPVPPEDGDLEARIPKAETALPPRAHVDRVGHRTTKRIRRHVHAVAAHVAPVRVADRNPEALDTLDLPLDRAHGRHVTIVSYRPGSYSAHPCLECGHGTSMR